MLRGRESLIRLVGKRRRIESPDALLSQISAQAQLTKHHVSSGQTYMELNEENSSIEKNECTEITMSSLSARNSSGHIGYDSDVEKPERETDDKDRVLCPVCGKSIQRTDIIINEHLDMCLTRGSRRKLTQRTLLQFNVAFTSKEKVGADKIKLVRKDTKQKHMDKKLVANAAGNKFQSLSSKMWNDFRNEIATLNGNTRNVDSAIQSQENCSSLKTLKDNFDKITEVSSHVEEFSCKIVAETSSILSEEDKKHKETQSKHQKELADCRVVKTEASSEKTLGECSRTHECWSMNCSSSKSFEHSGSDNIDSLAEEEKASASRNCSSDFFSSLTKGTDMVVSSSDVQGGMSDLLMNTENLSNNILLGILDTFIVGRKFNQEINAEQGASISVIRDLQNPKDKNAIKVTYTGSECGPVLGHLPRELALHLSPLLDNNSLQIQGVITSIPENAFASVPIRLSCYKTGINDQEDFEKENLFNSTWLKAVCAVKLLNSFPSDNPKYQRNFKLMILTVLEHHSHLFSDDEKFLLESFQSLSGDGQRIFIRLYQRKGPWFRIPAISYPDVADVKSACKELVVAGYFSSLELEIKGFQDVNKDMLSMLSVPELRQLVSKGLSKKKSDVGFAKKDELLEWLLSSTLYEKEKSLLCDSGSIPSFYSLFVEEAGCCVKISELAGFLLWRVQRLFFLNGEQDLSAFLLVDMGLKKYPDYSCNQTQAIFSNRADLLEYEQALAVAQMMDMALDTNDMLNVRKCIEISHSYLANQQIDKNLQTPSRSIFLLRFSAAWAYTKILTLGVSVFERERRYEEAIELLKTLLSRSFCPGQRGYWTLRLSVDLEHIGQTEESLLVAERGIYDVWIRAGDRMALQRRILRLGKPPRRWKKPSFAKAVHRKIKEVYVRGRPLNCTTGAKSIFYGYDEQQCTVEELALQYYAREEGGCWKGVHTEGGIWMTYFGLLMWDVLFAAVTDVFWTPFQTAPLDLRTDSFYPSRESLIEAQLSKIQMGEAEKILAASWEAHFGTSCQGVNWERYSLVDLQIIASCIGGPSLAAVCKLLAEDYGSWASGMPDLLLWRTFSAKEDVSCRECCHGLSHNGISEVWNCCHIDTSRELVKVGSRGEAKLVEVKGPRDKLSEQQRAWILVLLDAGLSTEVCKITQQLNDQD